MAIDFSKLTLVDPRHPNRAQQNKRELMAMLEEASNYLSSFQWCASIREAYIGIAIEGVVAVILFRIEPAIDDADEWLWVIVGDLPPAYLVTDGAPNPATALDAYIGEMQRWVDAAKSGRSVEDLIPVNVASTRANARELERRLKLLDDLVLSQYLDDLK